MIYAALRVLKKTCPTALLVSSYVKQISKATYTKSLAYANYDKDQSVQSDQIKVCWLLECLIM